MTPLGPLLDRIRHLLEASHRDPRRSTRPQHDAARPVAHRDAPSNLLMAVKIGWTSSFLLLLSGVAPTGDHLALFEQLLNTCAMIDAFIACLCRDTWSWTTLNRWDEALLFVTLSLGLRIFV